MSKFFDRNNPLWNQHNIVITISILALFITLPLSVLMVATTERTADVRSRAEYPTCQLKNCKQLDPSYADRTFYLDIRQGFVGGGAYHDDQCTQEIVNLIDYCTAPPDDDQPPGSCSIEGEERCVSNAILDRCIGGKWRIVKNCAAAGQACMNNTCVSMSNFCPANVGREICYGRRKIACYPRPDPSGNWYQVTFDCMQQTGNPQSLCINQSLPPFATECKAIPSQCDQPNAYFCGNNNLIQCRDNFFHLVKNCSDANKTCSADQGACVAAPTAPPTPPPTVTPTPTPTPTPPTLSCDTGEQVATIAENRFENPDDISRVGQPNNAGFYYKYSLLGSSDITEPLDNWELNYKIIPRSVNSGQWGFNTSLHTCLNGCEKSEVGEGVTHWSSVINDTSHFYPDDPDSHQRQDYLAMIFNSLFYTKSEAETYCPSKDRSFTICTNDERGYNSDIFEFSLNQEYSVKITKMGDSLGVEISDQAGNQVFADTIPASQIPMNGVDIASWGNLKGDRDEDGKPDGLIYDVSVNQDKRLDWYVKRPDTDKDMRFELDDLLVRGCTPSLLTLTVRMKGTSVEDEFPQVNIYHNPVDDNPNPVKINDSLLEVTGEYQDYIFPLPKLTPQDPLDIDFTNDRYIPGKGDRNLFVDYIAIKTQQRDSSLGVELLEAENPRLAKYLIRHAQPPTEELYPVITNYDCKECSGAAEMRLFWNGKLQFNQGSSPPHGHLSGSVKDANNAPIADVAVELLSSTGELVATRNTGAVGWYGFLNIAAGTYTIRASKAGFALQEKNVELAAFKHLYVHLLLGSLECKADFDRDGDFDGDDLAIIKREANSEACLTESSLDECEVDLNGDGVYNGDDYAIIKEAANSEACIAPAPSPTPTI